MAEESQVLDPNYEVPDDPPYNPLLRALKTTDPANAETTFNPLLLQMIWNTAAVKLLAEARAPAAHNHDAQYDQKGAADAVAALLAAQGLTVASVVADVTQLAFELAMKGLIDTDGMKHVVVDKIETAADVSLIQGRFDGSNKKVFI